MLEIIWASWYRPWDIHGKAIGSQLVHFQRHLEDSMHQRADGFYSLPVDGAGRISIEWSKFCGGPGHIPIVDNGSRSSFGENGIKLSFCRAVNDLGLVIRGVVQPLTVELTWNWLAQVGIATLPLTIDGVTGPSGSDMNSTGSETEPNSRW